MSEHRYQKNLKFKRKDREWIEKLLDMRDKVKYPTEVSYITHIFRTFKEEVKEDIEEFNHMDYELNNICSDGELIKSGDYFVCSRGGTYKRPILDWEKAPRRKKPHVYKIGKVAMTLETVKRLCVNCSAYSERHR